MNSKPIASSYASIFEHIWERTEMYVRYRVHSRVQREFIIAAAYKLQPGKAAAAAAAVPDTISAAEEPPFPAAATAPALPPEPAAAAAASSYDVTQLIYTLIPILNE